MGEGGEKKEDNLYKDTKRDYLINLTLWNNQDVSSLLNFISRYPSKRCPRKHPYLTLPIC